MSVVSEDGLARHISEEVILEKPGKKDLRGKLIFAVRNGGHLVEIEPMDKVGLRHAYPITTKTEGYYLQSYKCSIKK
ncbi:hypothetical protein J4407_03505 [Candidatus Pacearchaeota archaeon]|nr:hypothetical protein [Candidatus Pacearchaeota archaeon]